MFAKIAIFVVTAIGALLSSNASAAVPEAATTALTSIATDGTTLIDAGWPVLLAITTGFVLLRLFRRLVGAVT